MDRVEYISGFVENDIFGNPYKLDLSSLIFCPDCRNWSALWKWGTTSGCVVCPQCKGEFDTTDKKLSTVPSPDSKGMKLLFMIGYKYESKRYPTRVISPSNRIYRPDTIDPYMPRNGIKGTIEILKWCINDDDEYFSTYCAKITDDMSYDILVGITPHTKLLDKIYKAAIEFGVIH
jgi:uncharacterized protein YbaR (Trm112 family)